MHPTSLARTQGEKPAVVMAQSGVSMSYAQLEAYSNQGAQLLRALGLERGDTVALMLDNTLPFLAICLAAQRAGLFYVAMSSRLAEPEAAYVLDNCGAEVFIVSAALAQIAAGLMTQSPHVAARFSVGGPLPGHQSWEAAAGAQPTTPIADESLGQDMLYSSGTTGRPKGVRTEPPALGVGEATRLVGMLQTLYRFDADTIYLGPAPLYHAAPLRYAMSVLNLGGTVVVMEHFDAEAALALIETHRITHAQFVPTMFVRMLKLPEETRRRYDLSSLKAIIHAAAPCPVPVKEKMIDWWGPIIHEYYAGTEGNGMTVCDSAQWLAHKGTVGRAALGEVRILDEAGAVLPPGRAGGVYFADGPGFEYHGDPDKTRGALSPQGWSTLGDIGYLDAEGYLYLTDRKANMIISGGVNIYPQEVENLLVTHPKVADVAVIGVPDEDFGEVVKAVVQPADPREAGPALAAELIAFCRASISAVKCPKSVDFEMELPRAPTGKLYKRLIRDRYWVKAGADA